MIECMTYSHDLRMKALDYAERCGSNRIASQTFGITHQTLLNWIKLKKQSKLAPKQKQRRPSKLDSEKLKSYIQARPDAYLREIGEAFGTTLSAVFYACKRLKISLKKRPHFIRKGMRKRERSIKSS